MILENDMRRYAFYFAAALSAFATGVFFVYLFFLPDDKVRLDLVAEPTHKAYSLHHETGIESLISDKEMALLLFEPTLKKWIGQEKIAELVEPSSEIAERIAMMRLHQYEAPLLTQMAMKSYKPSLLDFNDDGKKELSIRINCEEPDGCELWIFREVEDDFEVVLRLREKFENFKLMKEKSTGFFDIETSYKYPDEPESEAVKRVDSYKFDGQRYRHRECWEYISRRRDKKGNLINLSKPILMRLDDCC